MPACGGHLAEVPVPSFRKSSSRTPAVVRREALDRVLDRRVRVRVAGDEEIGAAVAVHVGDRCAGMPAEGDDAGLARALGERAVAVVPEEHVVRRRRHVEVGVAVAVEVGGDAALAANGHVGVRRLRHVHEPAAHVAEQGAGRRAAVLRPQRELRVGVVVDREEVEPAVVVVVEPADSAAHHRLLFRRQAVPERALLEVESRAGGDVRQPVAAQHGAGRRCFERRRLRRRAERPARRRPGAAGTSAGELRDGDRRILVLARLEPHARCGRRDACGCPGSRRDPARSPRAIGV